MGYSAPSVFEYIDNGNDRRALKRLKNTGRIRSLNEDHSGANLLRERERQSLMNYIRNIGGRGQLKCYPRLKQKRCFGLCF
jgi:hypothetical protein